MIRRAGAIAFIVLATLVSGPAATGAAAQDRKLAVGVPGGPPPIFASIIAVVADRQSLFKKHGVDVEVKFPESGTAAARALISGDLDVALGPSALVVNQISNADADTVGFWGMPQSSHLLASTNPGATCKDTVGQAVGVDVIGGARANSLRLILASCGVRLEDVQQVALPSTATMQAMIADRLAFGMLHFDEIPVLERQGKPVKTIATLVDVAPDSHFLMATARRSAVAQRRDAYVRILAGFIAAARFIRDAKNIEQVAEIATITTRTKEQARDALARLNAIGYWPTEGDGLDRNKLEAVIATAVRSGNIRPGKTAVTYERLVDRSLWREAVELVERP